MTRQKRSLRSMLLFGMLLGILAMMAVQVGAYNGDLIPAHQSGISLNSYEGYEGVQFVHSATAANITSNWTEIDHPLTNNKPDAIVHATQNWNPGVTDGVYNDAAIGVWYRNSTGRWAIFNQDIAAMPPGADFNVFIPEVGAASFVHASGVGNILSNWTEIDHPQTNNNPDAILHVTQNYNPDGSSGEYNDHPIGVWYNEPTGRWAVFNQDLAAMPDGADFNVFIPEAESHPFVHGATAENIVGHWTEIDHPLANGNPNAILHVTQNWNPGDSDGEYNAHAIGLWYHSASGRWAIFNQGGAAMPEGADFNIFIPYDSPAAYVHGATGANTSGNSTQLDHPLTNEKPNAMVHITPNWNPGGGVGVYNDHATGVWYSFGSNRWGIFNQDLTAILEGASFNVLVPTVDFSTFVHPATAANSTSNWTEIDHPLINDNPDAIVHATQNYNPGGSSGEYNDHPIGVWYNEPTGRWAVFNQDLAAMPDGADFNVLIPPVSPATFVHAATAGNISGNWTEIDHPLINDNPAAMLHVTQNWNPGDSTGVYNDHEIGVFYKLSNGRWAIFNQDLAAMPDGADFNVTISMNLGYLPVVMRE